MLKSQVRFKYMQKDVVIQCRRDEQMKVIIGRYAFKQQIEAKDLVFIYGGNKVNEDLTFDQIDSKAPEILILVYSSDKQPSAETKKESEYVKCPECPAPAIIEFTDDFKIALVDKTHGKKKIKAP